MPPPFFSGILSSQASCNLLTGYIMERGTRGLLVGSEGDQGIGCIPQTGGIGHQTSEGGAQCLRISDMNFKPDTMKQ